MIILIFNFLKKIKEKQSIIVVSRTHTPHFLHSKNINMFLPQLIYLTRLAFSRLWRLHNLPHLFRLISHKHLFLKVILYFRINLLVPYILEPPTIQWSTMSFLWHFSSRTIIGHGRVTFSVVKKTDSIIFWNRFALFDLLDHLTPILFFMNTFSLTMAITVLIDRQMTKTIILEMKNNLKLTWMIPWYFYMFALQSKFRTAF